MKATLDLTLAAGIAFLAASTLTAQNVIYSETFRESASNKDPLAAVGWEGLQGPTGEPVYDGATPAPDTVTYLAINASVDYLFSNEDRVLAYTEAEPFGTTDPDYTFREIAGVSMDLQNQTSTEDLRVAVRIGAEDWYVSDQILNNIAGRATVSLDFSTAAWRALKVDPGTSLAIGARATPPGTGKVTAIGFYDDALEDRIRVHEYSVTALR